MVLEKEKKRFNKKENKTYILIRVNVEVE